MAKTTWIVRRVEDSGIPVQTFEYDDAEKASGLYANWAENAKRFNDQRIELVKVSREEIVDQSFTNLSFVPKEANREQ